MRKALYILSSLLLLLGHTQAQDQLTPLEETIGDLDLDGMDERIVVYNTARDTINGKAREVHIFKKQSNDWVLWRQIEGAVMPSEAGGALGDPFVGVEIKEGQLIFYHTGGDKDKWNYTHHFRLHQGSLELVAAKISFGTRCDSFTNIDFDLLTGLLSYKQESDNCNSQKVNEVLVDKRVLAYLDELPLMQGFLPGDNRMEVPGTNLVFFY